VALAGHAWQLGPSHWVASVSLAQSDAPQAWKAVTQWSTQVFASQVVFPPRAGWVQGVAQSPQCLASEPRSTQLEPQRVGALGGHAFVHPVWVQSGLPAGHCVVQLRQCGGEVRSVSQPSSGLAVQCPHPAAHAVLGTTQLPFTHWTPVADSTCESAVQL
jgi:hypothetical protein